MKTADLMDPRLEIATRMFLLVMHREAAIRHPQRIENPVPLFERLNGRDRLMVLNAMRCALAAATASQAGDAVPASTSA